MTTSLWVTLFLLGPAQTDAVPEAAPASAASDDAEAASEGSDAAGGSEAPLAPAEAEATSVDAVAAPAAAPTPSAAQVDGDAGLEAALLGMLDKASDPVRVAIAPIKDEDAERAQLLQARATRLLLQSSEVDVVSAARVKQTLDAAAADAANEQAAQRIATTFAADHVFLGEVLSAGGQAELSLRLLHVESGTVVAQATVPVEGAAEASSVEARTVRGALRVLAADLGQIMEQLPGDKRYQRMAVAPLEAKGAAAEGSRLDRFAQAELIKALADEGFLVVERERFDQALQQVAVGAQLAEKEAPQIGLALDAQAIVVGSVAESGDTFTVNVRVISVSDGNVIGAATATLRRENAVSLANRAIETRTAGDAFFRSAVAPGWGQFYNQEPVKGALFGAAVAGAAVSTVALGGGAILAAVLYQSATPNDALSGTARTQNIVFARGVRNGMVFATAGMAAITAGLWGANAADALVSALYAE
jgi:TolB-like protein